ncbi:MAG TPA: hypothetical protein VME19_19585 [Streptosporangiaceae bacterium]|nr:hypothetical protein [Streptosporangiaceae bacterium]
MDDRHDHVEDWLSERVDPLFPPAGTFDLIRRRARRRKYRKLAIATGSAAVIVAAAVTVPQVVNFTVVNPPNTSALAGRAASVAPRTGGGIAESARALHPTFPAPSPSPAPVPPNFRPTSVTFVGTDTGWVIGQAGTPGHCATSFCTSVARTDDAGNSWAGVPAPLTGAPDGATGVSQIRFLNLDDGWAFGPELWATHDGGQTWAQVGTHGMRVTDLETVGDRAFGIFATCTGGGAAFAAGCTSFTLYSSPAGTDDWTPVGPGTTGLTNAGQSGSASLTLTETRGYLLGPDGTLYSGPVDGSAPWQRVAGVPCVTGQAQQEGQPAGAILGAVGPQNLIVACMPGRAPGGLQKKLIFTSANGGASWQHLTVAPAPGVATSLAASPAETVMLATDQGIDVLPAGGTTWRQLTLSGAPAGGFAYVGMTTDSQGVALPADAQAGAVWFTFDGGQTWAPSTLNGS